MAPIISSVDIARSPEGVFAYIDALGRHDEWQGQIVSVRVETDGPTRDARLTLRLDFEGHRIGKLIAPLARRDARKQIPQDHARLKERLEQRA